MTPEMFRKLAALGLSHEQMAGVLEIFDADAESRKAKARERVQRWREKKRDETQRNVTEHNETQHEGSCAGDARGLDNLQTKKITGEDKKEETRAAAPRGDLAEFRSELSAILDADRIEALCAVRRKKRAPMTAHTGRLLVAAIQRCHLPPAEVADEMALRNWTSVKPDWLESKSSPARNSTAPPKNDLDRMNAALDSLISGDRHEPAEPYANTIETSFERGDGRSAEGAFQRPAIPARH